MFMEAVSSGSQSRGNGKDGGGLQQLRLGLLKAVEKAFSKLVFLSESLATPSHSRPRCVLASRTVTLLPLVVEGTKLRPSSEATSLGLLDFLESSTGCKPWPHEQDWEDPLVSISLLAGLGV